MYTEIVAGIQLKKDTPKSVLNVLQYMLGTAPLPEDLPAHPFFACERWQNLFRMSSYYFPVYNSHSTIMADGVRSQVCLSVRASTKNYNREIQKWFDWIAPYCESGYGDELTFLGTSRYEETSRPTLYFIDNKTGLLHVEGVQ